VEITRDDGGMATETDIREALRHVVDPEIGVNIVDLGLVYGIEVEGARARVAMTMTSPACPLAEYLKDLVASAIRQHVGDVVDVDVHLEWEPPWDPEMMSDEARRQLGEGPR
jgi:metal-sulfur cluster biosynthetic enzyme